MEREYKGFDFDSIPPGYCFKPHDWELIMFYLEKRVKNECLPPNLMHETNIYQFDPKTLTGRYRAQGDGEWYFFSSRDKKYKNGKRPNRAAGNGHWKATGIKNINYEGTLIGHKRTLVFYQGNRSSAQKTNWLMYEYTLSNSAPTVESGMKLDDYVLCKIYKNITNGRQGNADQSQPLANYQQNEDVNELLPVKNSPNIDVPIAMLESNNIIYPEIYKDMQLESEDWREDMNHMELPNFFDLSFENDINHFFDDILDNLGDNPNKQTLNNGAKK